MKLDFLRFFDACDPSRTLVISRPEDKQYYIDFADVRGGKIIEELERTITLKAEMNQPTCQLFTGHIGCGKSTELRRLQAKLESQDFHVVYFESTQDLDMMDVDISDILLAIIRQVSESLEAIGIKLQPGYFTRLFNDISDLLQTPIELSGEAEFSLPLGLGKITAQTKESPKLRNRLRQYLEPDTNGILESLNGEVLKPAMEELNRRGKKGLVVLVDNLDRIDNRPTAFGGRAQLEYLFVERGEQLRKPDCHMVYTIPLSLIFAPSSQTLTNRLGGGIPPKTLPMVSVQKRDGSDCEAGLTLLQRMVMRRAFPEAPKEQHPNLVPLVFDHPETLNSLCKISGGHVRNLLGMLYRCLQEKDPPVSRICLERVIHEFRDRQSLAITEDQRVLLKQVDEKQQDVRGKEGYETLLRSLSVFEYQDSEGCWFSVNPLLKNILNTL